MADASQGKAIHGIVKGPKPTTPKPAIKAPAIIKHKVGAGIDLQKAQVSLALHRRKLEGTVVRIKPSGHSLNTSS